MKTVLTLLIAFGLFAVNALGQVSLGPLTVMLATPSLQANQPQLSSLSVACSMSAPSDNLRIVLVAGSAKDTQDAGAWTGVVYKTSNGFTIVPGNMVYVNGSLMVQLPTDTAFFSTAKFLSLYVTDAKGAKVSQVVYYEF